jgi:TATA-binding protein-associated factor
MQVSEVHELSALQLSGLSARERNRAKRKAKQMARRTSKDTERRYVCAYMSCAGIHDIVHTMQTLKISWPQLYPYTLLISESEGPPTKKVKTSSVVVEQAGQSDKLLIDQVTDIDSVFDEVSGNQVVRQKNDSCRLK